MKVDLITIVGWCVGIIILIIVGVSLILINQTEMLDLLSQQPEIGTALTCEQVDGVVVCVER